MSETKPIRIAGVKAVRDYTLTIAFMNGRALAINLRDFVHRFKGLRPLRDPAVFACADVGEDGFSLVWPGDLDVGADQLYEMALEQNGRRDAAAFIRWRWRNKLSLSEAANALGLSRRMVSYYESGEQEVPRTVLLALKGWEAERQHTVA
ncbi:MAG: DUF2442 domain-containing protein [Steroidobacteraceae bacterium]